MKASKRFLFQVVLWFVIWVIIWFVEGKNNLFIEKNYTAYLVQIAVLALLIFYGAPKLLFNKKYVAFFSLFIGIIMLSSILKHFFSTPNFDPNMLPDPMIGGMDHMPQPDHSPRRLPPQAIAGPSPLFIHSLLLTVSFTIGTFLETLIFAQQKERETIKNINEKLATELKLLKSQINPHFLFNTLNNIYALSAINTKKTQESISYLAAMLRYVLYECEQPKVPLKKEINYIENYIKLFTVKSSKKYPITTDFDIDDENVAIAPMLLIPFLENALKHGNIEHIKEAYLSIQITQKNNTVIFKIKNSKTQKVVNKDGIGGIGLENVKKRLRILYPDKHEFFIENNDTLYSVSLKLILE
ncbi:histidine kinase [Cellulophaga baltica]|uniref:sensor histidine kinase n=1 Tax=Cellulophaga TaxID=104264 RepID=UPI001C0673FA|nr:MULTISPECIES: histidine kinase [Cellulophaga]MBU2996253.1 histidine kinase [Cellulophaga baltica]MDO6767648.1 histidine kinase [Cellulophaga sp. 1_MG-2023]